MRHCLGLRRQLYDDLTISRYLVSMRSIRLDAELGARLQRAAAARGESLSEFIRRAAAERADATLAAQTTDCDDVLGVVHGGGGRAR